MIIEIRERANKNLVRRLLMENDGVEVSYDGKQWAVISSSVRQVPKYFLPHAGRAIVCQTDVQLAGKSFYNGCREISFGPGRLGGSTGHTAVIAGPCAVESEQQIRQVAGVLREQGVKIFRAGCFKPRTSPYSFQGLGARGLELLARIREEFGLAIITEVRDATHVAAVIEHADIVQIGAKAMYDHGILRACGACQKPVLIKRGFGTTLQEFIQAAEFVLSGGNSNVVLCERGIRTFETKTRFTLDLCGVAYLKEHTNLPVVVDPSHAMGYAYGVPDLARAAVAMGIDGLLVEIHPDPANAKSDAAQQLNLPAWGVLLPSLRAVARSVGRQIV
jgi:3-deoxy-7-phosphoheptulonate synthase